MAARVGAKLGFGPNLVQGEDEIVGSGMQPHRHVSVHVVVSRTRRSKPQCRTKVSDALVSLGGDALVGVASSPLISWK